MKRYCALLFLFTYCHINGYSQTGNDSSTSLQTVIVSANKLQQKRTEAPIAITVVGNEQIEKSKANRIDYLLNKVSGVYMPSIGGEQHMMSIRQPISLKGLYLYLEDGLPIRTSGLFSSNALIEINTNDIHSIEIIKGPASALYGAEAIGGVVNFITAPLPKRKNISVSNQINSTGLFSSSLHVALPQTSGGWIFNGAYTNQKNGVIDFTDYNKKAISIKKQFQLSNKLSGYQSLQYINYFTQMTGSVDSIHFVNKDFKSQQSFTYRKLEVLRWRQFYTYEWNTKSKTEINLLYRSNTMDQNPTYSIAATPIKYKFKGQINSNHFDAYVLDIQHHWKLGANNKLIVGGYWDITHQSLIAHYIDIIKDTTLNKYTSYTLRTPDSLLTNYQTQINNKAIYLNFIAKITPGINLNAAIRYDDFNYNYNNSLLNGTPSANNHFMNWTPKIGLTFNKDKIGGYLNYSKGFVPPQITEIYNAIRVPYLLPQDFTNYEIGGWFQLNNLYGELSLYQLNGNNEIISVRQNDGVNLNQNAGSTKHIGIEYQLKYALNDKIELALNATNARHKYVQTNIKGVEVGGKFMNAAPSFFSNSSVQWRLNKSITAFAEWHHQAAYYMDETNTTSYPGFNLINVKVNYHYKQHDFWLHILNAGNTYYSTMATKNFSLNGSSAYAYYIGEPRTVALGWKWSIIK
jgi:outer membrane receptor protein involved in Fe transport